MFFFFFRVFLEINHPASLGYHDLGNLHIFIQFPSIFHVPKRSSINHRYPTYFLVNPGFPYVFPHVFSHHNAHHNAIAYHEAPKTSFGFGDGVRILGPNRCQTARRETFQDIARTKYPNIWISQDLMMIFGFHRIIDRI